MVEESWAFAEVEEKLVEAMHLWWRSPGGGSWPYAGDAPWHLMTKDRNLGDYDEQHGNEDVKPRSPLTRDEVAERDRISEWLRVVPDRDRKLVVLVLRRKAKGDVRIKWKDIRAQMTEEISPRGLGLRYSRAITAIVAKLNLAEICAVGVSRQLVSSDQNIGCSPTAS